MIWTSRFLFLHPLTTMGVDLAEFIAARSNEPVFQAWDTPRRSTDFLRWALVKPQLCLLEAEQFFSRKNESILDFERIFVGIRNPYDLELARYLRLLSNKDPEFDPSRNIARKGSFRDFLEFAPLDGFLPPRLDRYLEVLGEAPGNLRELRFESFEEDFCTMLSPYLSDVEAIGEWIPRRHRFEQVYDAETEALCFRRNRWFFESGRYPRLTIDIQREKVQVGPISVLALLSGSGQDDVDGVEGLTAKTARDARLPLVSVAIPFCNDAEFLCDALASIYRQTSVDWELLLVDCGSSDGSREMVEELLAVDPRVRCLSNDAGQGLGVSAPRDVVYQHARGEFLAWLPADCAYVSDEAFSEQVGLMRSNPMAAMVCGPAQSPQFGDNRAGSATRLFFADRLLTPLQFAAGTIRQWNGAARPRMERLSLTSELRGYEPSLPAFAQEFGLLVRLAARYGAYVSSRCWYQGHTHSTSSLQSVVEQCPHPDEVLSVYDWADEYLRVCGTHDRHTREALRYRTWPFRWPRLWRWRFELLPEYCSTARYWLDQFSPWNQCRWRYATKQMLRWQRCRLRVMLLRATRLLDGKARGNIGAAAKVVWLEQLLPGEVPAATVQLHWDTSGIERIAIRISTPDGAFVVGSEDPKGTFITGKWVEDRAWFFLQDAAATNPGDITATLDVMQVRVRERARCPD